VNDLRACDPVSRATLFEWRSGLRRQASMQSSSDRSSHSQTQQSVLFCSSPRMGCREDHEFSFPVRYWIPDPVTARRTLRSKSPISRRSDHRARSKVSSITGHAVPFWRKEAHSLPAPPSWHVVARCAPELFLLRNIPCSLTLPAPLKRVHWRVDPFSSGVMPAAVCGSTRQTSLCRRQT